MAAEIQDLVNILDDLRATVLGVLEILRKVIDFHVGAIHLGGEEQQGLFVLVNKPVDERFIGVLGEQLQRETPGPSRDPAASRRSSTRSSCSRGRGSTRSCPARCSSRA